jgi:hypothetical protein
MRVCSTAVHECGRWVRASSSSVAIIATFIAPVSLIVTHCGIVGSLVKVVVFTTIASSRRFHGTSRVLKRLSAILREASRLGSDKVTGARARTDSTGILTDNRLEGDYCIGLGVSVAG